MSWVTAVWSMIASACLTLAMAHALVWWGRGRKAWTHGIFALTALETAFLAGCELWMFRAATPGEFGAALRWGHVPVWFLVLSLVAFVRLYLRAGRPWLAWTVCALRTLSLILNFVFSPNINYREITGLRHIPFLGETVAVADGVRNPWMVIGQLSLVLLVIFVADAALAAWRRGDRREALFVGGSIVLFTTAGTSQAILFLWGIVHAPIMASVFYMGIVAAMAFEVSRDLLRADKLSEELRESEQRMSMAVDAANFGIWIRMLPGGAIWATKKWRELFGFTPGEPLSQDGMLQRLHAEDREAVSRTLLEAQATGGAYEIEYRILLPEGRQRWISSHGFVELDAARRPSIARGTSRDCTVRKLAEEAAHNLSGRLIHAQEEAQTQLGRELHDDVCQSLALLSVELEMFGRKTPAEAENVPVRMEQFSAQVKALSTRVHHLSHELHPAKLELGLVAAVRGFCKEFARAHQLVVRFSEHNVPQNTPGDTGLCLYRIAQEALHNVVKHSGATEARVELTQEEGQLRMVIADDGAGFDPATAGRNGSLGLVSMSERARFVGGRLTVESWEGVGTRVVVRVPIPQLNGVSHNGSEAKESTTLV